VKLILIVFAAALPPAVLAQQPHEQEVQRALIELDRRSAEFARGQPPSSTPLPPYAGQPLSPDPEVARQLRPYERMRIAEEGAHVLQLSPPVNRTEEKASSKEKGSFKPLPLPRRPESVVDPVDLPRPRD
jgi:hypothetical protein